MIGVGLQAGAAETPTRAAAPGKKVVERAKAGALPVKLSPAQRAALLRTADKSRVSTEDTLGLGAKERLLVSGVTKDSDGTVHTRYNRTYAGLPVLGGDLTVHESASGTFRGATKATNKTITVPTTTAQVTGSAAKSFALKAAKDEGAKKPAVGKEPRKVVWAAKGSPVLAWESVVGGFQHDGTPSELHVVTDARTGGKLYEYEAVRTGTGNSQYSGQVTIGTSPSGSQYQMNDTGRGGHKTYDLNGGQAGTGTLFTDADDTWGNGQAAEPQTAGVDAQYGAQLTWDYYKTVHGRNGIRGDGVGAYSRVHYGDAYVNAFWSDSCFCMTYGDGTGNAQPLTSIDVAAHEMTHGVTSHTAGLVYSDESGGLNEATSDIFAAAVEFWANNSRDVGDYLVGEEIDIRGNGTPLRYMDRPSRDGVSKDSWYSGIGGIDVHHSSGPANHFFYLLSEGSGQKTINGVTYDSPTSDGQPVPGIGRANAEKIWWKALSTYMQSNTTYADARTTTLQAAADLFGSGSATYNTVADTWAAINVGSRVPGGGVSVGNPGAQTSVVGQPDSAQVTATSSNSGALAYSATGLPAGLSVNAVTGLISGTPTTVQSTQVTVTVKDSAGVTGTTSFSWNVTSGGSGGTEFVNTEPVAIPDRGAAVESPITVSGRTGNAPSALKVGVDITHTYRGDLVVELVAPDGTAYRLKSASGGDSAADVKTTYTVNASGEAADGTWKLRVQDLYTHDTGRINGWKLTF